MKSSTVFRFMGFCTPIALTVTGCTGPAGTTAGNTLTECRALTAPGVSAARPEPPFGWGGTVFTIVMENHNLEEILGNPSAPYINELASQNAVAAGYHDSYIHPSEPNYIWMVAGENFGILNDDDPSKANTIASQSHLVDQLENAGLPWKSYQESLGSGCGLRSHGLYAAKHNPFVYFSDINGWNGSAFAPTARCTEHVVDYTQLDADLAAGNVPAYAFITPNMIHDMHDGTVADGDTWLSHEVPKILASDAYKNGGVIYLLWDEGSKNTDSPPFIAISPNAKHGYVSHVAYDTSAFLKTVQANLAIEALPCSPQPETVPTMDDLFVVPVSGTTPQAAGTPTTK